MPRFKRGQKDFAVEIFRKMRRGRSHPDPASARRGHRERGLGKPRFVRDLAASRGLYDAVFDAVDVSRLLMVFSMSYSFRITKAAPATSPARSGRKGSAAALVPPLSASRAGPRANGAQG